MTTTQTALTEATARSAAAREAFDSAPSGSGPFGLPWSKAKTEAEQDLQFWSNKVAYLEAALGLS